MKRPSLMAAGRVLLAAVFIALAVHLLKGRDLGLVFRRPEWVAAVVAGMFATQALCSWRLQTLFRGAGFPVGFGRIFRLVGFSFFTGSVFPGILGQDVVKLAGFRFMDRGSGLGKIAFVLLVDRLAGLFAILFFSCALSFLVPSPGGAGGSFLGAMRWPFLAALPGLLLGMLFLRRGTARVLPFVPARFRERAASAANFFASPGALGAFLRAILISFLSIGAMLFIQGGIGHALHRVAAGPSPWITHVFLATGSMMVSALPIAPAGMGVGQAALSTLYGWFGLDPSTGLLLITLMQIGQIVAAVCLGLSSFAPVPGDKAPA